MKNNILLALIMVLLTGCAGILNMPKNINDNDIAIDEFNNQSYKLVSKEEFINEYKMVSIDNYVVDEKQIYNTRCHIKLVRKQFSTTIKTPSTLIGGENYIFIKKDGKIQYANCSTYLQILALTDCITIPLSKDTLCSYTFHFGPTSDVKQIDAVDGINKIRDSYANKNKGLIFSMGTENISSGNLPTISYAYKVIEENIVDLSKDEVTTFRNVTKGKKGRHSISEIMRKPKDCFIISKYGKIIVKAYSTGSIDFVVFNDGAGYSICKNSIAGPLKKPKIYSQKEFAERKIFFEKQNIAHNEKLKAEKQKSDELAAIKVKKEKKEYISKYFYTKEDLLKVLHLNTIYEWSPSGHTECSGMRNMGDYYNTMILNDDGSLACYTTKDFRQPAVESNAKWSITDCEFRVKNGVFVNVPAVKISDSQDSHVIFVILNKPLPFEIQTGGMDSRVYNVAERSSDYYDYVPEKKHEYWKYRQIHEISEVSGIKCTSTSSGSIKARIRSLEYTKRKGWGKLNNNKTTLNDDGGIYVNNRTKIGADPMDIALIPKSKFIQGHTPEKALAAFKNVKYTKKQRYIFYDEMWEHMKAGEKTEASKALFGEKGILDFLFIALELKGVDRRELDIIKEDSKEKFYSCFERDLGNIKNNLKGRMYLFMLKHSEYTGRRSFHNVIDWGKIKGANEIIDKANKGGKEGEEFRQIMILTPVGCLNRGIGMLEDGIDLIMEIFNLKQ